jgi:hypothetical protein
LKKTNNKHPTYPIILGGSPLFLVYSDGTAVCMECTSKIGCNYLIAVVLVYTVCNITPFNMICKFKCYIYIDLLAFVNINKKEGWVWLGVDNDTAIPQLYSTSGTNRASIVRQGGRVSGGWDNAPTLQLFVWLPLNICVLLKLLDMLIIYSLNNYYDRCRCNFIIIK